MKRLITPITTLVLIALVAVPLVLVVVAGFVDAKTGHPTLLYLREALAHPAFRLGLRNSFAIAAATTVLAVAITLPLAWISHRYRFRGKGLAEALLLAPLILPPFVGALGVFQLLGQYGVLNVLGSHLGLWTLADAPDWLGRFRLPIICLVEALGLYPILYLALTASFARLDPALSEAAASLGASRLTVFRRVVVPLVKPGLFAGASVVFVWSFTELGTPLMLGFDRVTPVQVFNGLTEVQSNRLPYALAVVMLVVVAAIYLGVRRLLGRTHEALVIKGSSGDGAVRLAGWRAILAWLPFAGLAFLATAPHLVVILLALAQDWYRTLLPSGLTLERFREALAHPQVVPAIINSLVYSTAATLLAVVLGTTVAWITVRLKPRGAALVDGLAMIPLAVPGLIMAFGFLALGLLLTTVVPFLRPFLDPQVNPAILLVVAYAIRRLPHVVRATSAGLAQAPVALEEAAAACGAGMATRLRRITIPLIAGSLAAGALLTFSFSMLEVSDSLVLAVHRDHWPVTKVIYDLVSVLGSGPAIACAFATWAMCFLTACLAASAAFLGKGPTALFRE